MTQQQIEAKVSLDTLKLMVAEMEYVLSCINEDKIPFDGDDFHEALRLGRQAIKEFSNYKRPAPEAHKWVGLTPEQRKSIAEENNMLVDDDLFDAIEAKLREKNSL